MIYTINPIRLLGFYYQFQRILKIPPPVSCAEFVPHEDFYLLPQAFNSQFSQQNLLGSLTTGSQNVFRY